MLRRQFMVLNIQIRKERAETSMVWTSNSVLWENVLQNWRRNKDFLSQTKLGEVVASRPALQEMFKEVIQRDGKFL